jgi:hypothetical protein
MATQIERNAAVVADLAGSDWQMAYVIACSVANGGPNGKTLDRSSDPDKVTAAEFARKVKEAAGGTVYGLGKDGIAARLRKWDEFAQDWNIPASADLRPKDANAYPAFPDTPFARQDGAAGQDESNKGKVKDIANNPRSNAIALSDAATASKVIDEMTPQALSDFIDTAIQKGKLTPAVSDKMKDHYDEQKRQKNQQKDSEMSRVEWFAHMMLKIGEAEKRAWGQRALMDLRDELNVRLVSFDDITPEMFTK